MNIPDIVLKIKALPEDLIKWTISIGILILIGITAFLGGKISSYKPEVDSEPISVLYPPQVAITKEEYKAKTNSSKSSPATAKTNWLYAGSKTGKTYYTKDCKGINRVKPENRVYFITREEATAAGYSLSKTCHDSI